MANAIVSFKVMPDSPEVNMDDVQAKVSELLKAAGAKGEPTGRIEPVAFGIKHLYITAMFETTDESNDYDTMTNDMDKIEGVSEAILEKIDLAMG